MRILLIGTGYVGIALIDSWKDSNDHFVGITTKKAKLEEIKQRKQVKSALLLKITKSTDLKEILDQCDAVIITVAPTKEASYKEAYLNTALAVSNSLKERARSLFLLYTSTTSVYGNHQGALIDEAADRNPLSEEIQILCEAEDHYLSCATSNIEICILRLGGIYGPSRTLEHRTRKMSKKSLGGSGREPTNHIHIEDITGAIEFCVINRLSGIYNLVNDDHPYREKLYSQVSAQLKISPPIWEPSLASDRLTNVLVSNYKIKSAGYVFKHPHLT